MAPILNEFNLLTCLLGKEVSVKKLLLVITLFFCMLQALSSEGINKSDEEKGFFLLNFLAPGAIQIYEGKDEGYAYLPGMALEITGTILMGKNYVPKIESPVAVPIGLLLKTTGESMIVYSWYAYMHDQGQGWQGISRRSYPDLLLAPWDYRNILSPEILPIVGVVAINALTTILDAEACSKLGAWYSRDEVLFWGGMMHPAVASGIDFAWSLLAMTGVAISEETGFRGILTPLIGPEWSAIAFGSMHFANLLVKKPTVKNIIGTTLQVLSATGLGFYFDKIAKDNNGDLSKPVAFHYWWNVSASAISFLNNIINPEEIAAAPASTEPSAPDAAPAEPAKGLDDVSLYFNDKNLPGVMLTIRL